MSEAIEELEWEPPPSKIRGAAAVILVRGEPRDREVFWVRRGKKLTFGPGMYAFPGGKIDEADASAEVEGLALGEGAPLVAAAREAFEEVGILLAEGAEALSHAALGELRRALLDGASFTSLLREHGLTLDSRRLVPAGRWLTPDFSPVRFDTHFFLAEAPSGAMASIEKGELSFGEWVRPADALAKWEQGEAILHPPTHHALAVLAGFPFVKAAPILRNPPFMDDDHVVHRIEFQRGIHLFPLRTQTLPPATHTNCYVVGTRELVVIDPGSPFPEERDRIAEALAAMVRDGREVKAVLLTHHHQDHVAGARDLAERLEVPLLASAATARRVEGAEGSLVDGATIDLDGPLPMRLRCLLTEGHADGHLCFLEEGSGAVIAGDLVADGSTIVVDPPEGKMDLYLESLRRVLALPAKVLYPAHGFPIPEGAQLLERYFNHREGRIEAIRDLLGKTAGPISLADVVKNVYSETPSLLHPVAERSALASLIELRRRGLAQEEGGGWTAT